MDRRRERDRSRERDGAGGGMQPPSAYSMPPAMPYGGGMGAPGSMPNLGNLSAFAAASVRHGESYNKWSLVGGIIASRVVFLTRLLLLFNILHNVSNKPDIIERCPRKD